MIPALREAFNRNFLPETYQQLLRNLEAAAGVREPVTEFVGSHPGIRLIDGRFMEIRQAVGTTKAKRPDTIRFLHKLVEELKASGFVADVSNVDSVRDMIAYAKDGRDYILMANSNRGVMKLDASDLGKYGAITDKIAATEGVPYETVEALQGVRRLDRFDETSALAMVATGEALNLTTIALP